MKGRLGCGRACATPPTNQKKKWLQNYAVLGHDELSKDKGAPVQKGGSHIFQTIPKNDGLNKSKRIVYDEEETCDFQAARQTEMLLPRP
jgi:hypothetical protein